MSQVSWIMVVVVALNVILLVEAIYDHEVRLALARFSATFAWTFVGILLYRITKKRETRTT